MADLKKILRIEIVLVLLILFGVFFRFYHLDVPLQGDEIIYGISAMKFHQESFTAGKDYVQEHPPLGKWLVGLPSLFTDADYSSLKLLGQDLFVWSYMAHEPLEKNFMYMRMMEAIGGTAAILIIFLISRQMFGLRAGLWSAVIAALSFEMIGYSRIIYMETPMIFFSLITFLLYINYLKSSGRKRFAYLGLFFISITATLLTRGIQPLFLLPIFAVSQFATNRNMKENVYFALFLGISYYLAFNVIFPFDILGYGPSRYGESSVFGLIAFKVPVVVMHTIFRNSLLFLASLMALGYAVFQSKKKIHEKFHPAILVFFGVSFLIFSFMSFPLPRHYIFMFLPLYIVGGYAITQVSGNKAIATGIVLLAVINAAQLVQYFPNFLTYTNFGLDSFQVLTAESSQNLRKGLDTANNENPQSIMTNDVNTLIFFEGNKLPITPTLGGVCTEAAIDSMDLESITVIYVRHSNNFDFASDPFVCPLLKTKLSQTNFKLLEI